MGFLLRIVLAAALVSLAPGVVQAKNAVASPALQKEFDGFIEKFRAALRTNDSVAVAGMTRLPFMNDNAIRDAAQFRAKTYRTSFTAKNRACKNFSAISAAASTSRLTRCGGARLLRRAATTPSTSSWRTGGPRAPIPKPPERGSP